MPTVEIKHKPDLTKEKVLEVFKIQLSGKYKVIPSDVRLRDLFIVKSDWSGVAMKLKQDTDKTALYYCTNIPGKSQRLLAALTFGILPMLIYLSATSKQLVADVKRVIYEAPEFQ